MLSLLNSTTALWVRRVEQRLDQVLIDHAHCEKKAAGVAVNLIFAYVEHTPLLRALSEVAEEELQHLRMVSTLLEERGIRLHGQPQSTYGQRLAALTRRKEPERVVDRCLIAALIEARSCDRFTALSRWLRDRELRDFYGRLLESEARHHTLYLDLAETYAPRATVRARLGELAHEEARILASEEPIARLHSRC